VPAFAPDLVLMSMTYFTPTVLWQDPPKPYKIRSRRNPFFDIHTLRVIDDRFKLGLFPPDDGVSDLADPANITAQLQKAADHLEDFSKHYQIPVAIIKMAYTDSWSRTEIISPLQSNPVLHMLDVRQDVIGSGYKPEQLRVSVWDSHPNSLAQNLIAKAVYAALEEEGLLPQAPAIGD
jgi:lambda repressor-like predicted transcriptional regulator